ncbi:MAG TPA: TetR/AcrR family transcriptional regulator [Streptosporangiaceae bacterium]|jgi:AcrR family transcriptional regulator|nr:TetR/AcrR family transcriptional regulator [Streptosporangiaceae bacterium]
MPALPATPPSMRDRYRAQVRQEVKDAALRQLAAAGPAGVSISAIGKELGVSGPALYRYFASRDDLLTELVIDAYDDLARALRAAADAASGLAPRARLDAMARAYRAWALAEPHRYRLLYAPPLPGYDAHTDRLVEASEAAMNLLLHVIAELNDGADGAERPPLPDSPVAGPPVAGAHAAESAARSPGAGSPVAGAHAAESPAARSPGPESPLAAQLTAWAGRHRLGADPATALRAVLVWSRLHGFVSLEIAGNYASMGIDPDPVFEVQLATLLA